MDKSLIAVFVVSMIMTLVVWELQRRAHEKSERELLLLLAEKDKVMRAAVWLARNNDHDDVGAFHQQFDLWNTTYCGPGPRPFDVDLVNFRVKFMQEELQEFIDAANGLPGGLTGGTVFNRSEFGARHAEMFDALLDLVYVAHGTAHLLGYPWREGWLRVQAANMAKRRSRGDDDPLSKRATKWDVVKPAGWRPPDIQGVLAAHGWPSEKISAPQARPGV